MRRTNVAVLHGVRSARASARLGIIHETYTQPPLCLCYTSRAKFFTMATKPCHLTTIEGNSTSLARFTVTLTTASERRKQTTVTVFVIGLALLVCVSAGGIGLGYGGYGAGYGGGGLGVGSSVVLLRGGPGFAKAVAGPTFLVSTVHHVNKLHGGGAIVAHSGLGGYGAGYGLGYGGYGIKG